MKTFVLDLLKKPNNKALMVFATVLGILTLLTGILAICDSAKANCGIFINNIIASVLFFILAYLSNKNDKKKSLILMFVLMVDFILTTLDGGIQNFISYVDLSKLGVDELTITTLVFSGLGLLVLFAGINTVLYHCLSDKANKENYNCLSGSAFFVAAILTLCNGGNSLTSVTSFLNHLLLVGQAIFFALKSFELLKYRFYSDLGVNYLIKKRYI